MLKYMLFTTISLTFFSVSYGLDCPNCDQIIVIDQQIYEADNHLISPALKSKEITEHMDIYALVDLKLIPALKLEESELFKTRLAMITHVETISWLDFVMNEKLIESEDSIETRSSYLESPALLKERIAEIKLNRI